MISSNSCVEHEAVTNFREYLRIPSVHPNIDYSECVKFILRQAQSLGLLYNIYYMAPGKPIVIITWTGQKPELPSILLNSHMDVVPVYPDNWTYKPFSAHKDGNGDIYARGAQDMKCIAIQYLETIRRYRREKLVFDRTIHVSFVPDEEIGGFFGMRTFVKSPEFLALNVGFALDEGMPSTDNSFTLYYGERTFWHLYIKCMGTPGHGSLLHENTAGEKLRYIIDKFMDWRDCEKLRLKNCDMGPGDVTSVNLTIIEGGCQVNVVPPELTVYFDVRLAVEVDGDIMESVIKQWCKEAGEGVTLAFMEKGCQVKPTKLNDENLYWVAFKNQFDNMNLKVKTSIFPGSTDSIFIREIPNNKMAENKSENESVTLFREYLRIPSVQPNVNYSDCVKFFKGQAEKLGLPIKVHYMSLDTPIVVITLTGKQVALPSVLLSSHMDVVPVYPKFWKHNPFSAYKDETGNIYARGAQDMKCVSIQYIETIKKYLQEKLSFNRTIHMCFTPDEETGGPFGIRKFVKTSEFAEMNVGFVLDEGKATPNEVFNVFYGERTVWDLTINCSGTTGHGSILHESTAGEKLQYIINKFMNWRECEKTKLRNTNLEPGDVTSINLTEINGGCQVNVVPPEISVSFDIRLAVEEDPKELEKIINSWCIEAGKGVSVEFKKDPIRVPPTKIGDNNPWWAAFKRECNNMKLKINPCIFTGATDSRFIRNVGIPALGFSPMNHTTPLAHDHNEFLNENIFIKGLDIYYNIIKALASV